MNRWKRLWRRGDLERELDAELREHLARQVADYVAAGMPETEARRKARLAFGGLDQVKETCRDARGLGLVADAMHDSRYVLRMFRANPGFALVALVTLALGIGANTAIWLSDWALSASASV